MRALILSALVVACSPPNKKCKDQTLFVSVTLQGATQNADQIFVDVSLDGGAAVHTTLSHTAGRGMGGVEIDFPGGYPTGHKVDVTLTALVSGSEVGRGNNSRTLANSCDALDITVMPSMTTGDLAGADFSGVDFAEADLAPGPDLQQPDLQLPDLTTFVDLLNCAPVTENCFNGTDDDCDGLIDCADPDCVGGATPKAACVSDPGTTVGVAQAGTGSCPAPYPSSVPLGSSYVDAMCGVGTCGCSSTIVNGDACVLDLRDEGSDSTCSASTNAILLAFSDQNAGCANATATVPDGNYHLVDGPQWTYQNNGTPCVGSPTGTPSKTNASFSNHDTFCVGATMGAGCNAGQLCMPKAASYCVMLPGNQVNCPGSYVKRGTHYFTGIDDSMDCQCVCTLTGNGSCSATGYHFYNNTDCAGGMTRPGGGCANSNFAFPSARVDPPTTPGSCGGTVGWNVTSKPTGEQTICCLP